LIGIEGLTVQEPNNTEAERFPAAEAPAREWRKPVLTIIPANSAENGPGFIPDSGGFDFS
jgi:hypothetical protein